MAENNLSTTVKEVTFDSVIAEFDKKDKENEVIPQVKFVPKEGETNKIFDTKPEIKKEETVVEPEKKTDLNGLELPENMKQLDNNKDVKDVDSVLDRKPDEEKVDDTPLTDFVSVLEQLSKEEVIFPFDEDKPLKDYTPEDLKELLKSNIEYHKKEALENEISDFFQSLPVELQYAAKYVADGGSNLKELFKALAATQEVRTLDVKSEVDQEEIISQYYRTIEWGTDEEIKEEVERIKELGKSEVEKLAIKFKPKLEKMHEEVTQQQLARQERAKQIQQQEMDLYLENAHEAIKTGKIGDVQLDKTLQANLWAGLTQPSYQTRRGAATNKLGHLLEKYQYVEPNFEKIYKVLWLLEDEESFEKAVSLKAQNKQASSTARTLKTEQSKKTGSVGDVKQEDATRQKKVIQRNSPGFMSGFKK